MPEEQWGVLRERIAERKVLVVIGTGVSLAATEGNELASWKGLIKHGVRRCSYLGAAGADAEWEDIQRKLLDRNKLYDLLGVAEQVSRRLGWSRKQSSCSGRWKEWLRDAVGSLHVKKGELIEAIRDLDMPIATLNYDNLLNEVMSDRRPLTWQQAEDWLPVLQGKDKAILHLHGHCYQQSSVVLGISSYDAVTGEVLAQDVLKTVVMTHSLLFIGCGGTFEDPNLTALLSWLREYGSRFEHNHYLLLRCGEPPAVSEGLLRNSCIELVHYGKQYADLLPFIQDLAGKRSTLPSTTATSFINNIIEKGLMPFLRDIGLSQHAIDWLRKEDHVTPLFCRLIIKAFALFTDKSTAVVGESLLTLLTQPPFFTNVDDHKLRALVDHLCTDLNAQEDLKQILAGQRSKKVPSEAASSLPQDLQGVLTLVRQSETLPEIPSHLALRHVIDSWLSTNRERFTTQPALQINVFDEEPGGMNRFLYGTQKTSFLGRKAEITALEKFLAAPERFLWWLITGEAGLGKSRLALELCFRNGNVWRAGFLPTLTLDDYIHDYIHWVPNQPTLIIADYAANRAGNIGQIIRIVRMNELNNKLPFQVRFLLLERHEKRYFRGRPEEIDVRKEPWFRDLLGFGNDREHTVSSWYPKRAPMVLGPLEQDATWRIICAFAFGTEDGPNEEKIRLLRMLETMDPLCRPLFAAVLGDSIGAGLEYHSILDTLIDILAREEQLFWVPQWTRDGITSEEDRDNDKDVLAVATMAGDIDTERVSVPEDIKAMITRPRFSTKRYARMAAGSTDTLLRPLTPGIIGEAFVLQRLMPDNPIRTERLERIKRMAWSLNADNMIAFLHRAETDFPNHPTLAYLRRTSTTSP